MTQKHSKEKDKAEVQELARLHGEVGPLAELVNSSDFSDEDRSRLRELVGPDRYFELSTNLNQMCGSLSRLMGRADFDPEAREELRERGFVRVGGGWTRG